MKLLILDLDETLVYSTLDAVSPHCTKRAVEGNEYYTMFRPGLHPFLHHVRKYFECYIWSTGQQPYVEDVWSHIDMDGFKLWGRNFCSHTSTNPNEPYEKPLRKITDDLTQAIIVDNTASVFAKTPLNGIEIRTWHGDQSDTELEHLAHYLDWLRHQTSFQRDHSAWRFETLCLRSK